MDEVLDLIGTTVMILLVLYAGGKELMRDGYTLENAKALNIVGCIMVLLMAVKGRLVFNPKAYQKDVDELEKRIEIVEQRK